MRTIILFIISLVGIAFLIFFLVRANSNADNTQTNTVLIGGGLGGTRPQAVTKVIAFSGGGTRAFATSTGLMHGIGRRLISTDNGTLKEFVEDHSILSGVSGGSWFMSLMIYSKSFWDMLCTGNIQTEPSQCLSQPIPGSQDWSTYCTFSQANKCDGNKCCCAWGYKYNGSLYDGTNFLPKCELCDPLPVTAGSITFQEYVTRMMSVISSETLTDSFSSKLIRYLPTSLGLNLILPTAYHYSKRWNEIIKQIVFDTVGDINNTKVSENPNNFSNHCLWGAVIMQESVLTGDTRYFIGDKKRTTCIGDTTFQNCGNCFPITYDYDLAVNSSTMTLYGGNIPAKIPITYINNITKQSIESSIHDLIYKNTSSNSLIRDLGASSGGFGAVVTQYEILRQALKDSWGTIYSIFGYTFDWVLNSISKTFAEKAPPIILSSNEIKFLEKIEDLSLNSYAAESYIRTGDGGYYDGAGITNGIRGWQNDGGTGRCKIISSMCMQKWPTFQDFATNSKTVPEVYQLFGCVGNQTSDRTCKLPVPKTRFPSESFKIPFLTEPIFRMEDFSSARCLWWGRCTGNKSYSCSESGSNCVVEIAIMYYRTVTIQNDVSGIKAGTNVDLFVLNINSVKADIFIMPGVNDLKANLGFVETAQNLSDLIQKIPLDLFELVFLDQGNVTEYQSFCGTEPVCA